MWLDSPQRMVSSWRVRHREEESRALQVGELRAAGAGALFPSASAAEPTQSRFQVADTGAQHSEHALRKWPVPTPKPRCLRFYWDGAGICRRDSMHEAAVTMTQHAW